MLESDVLQRFLFENTPVRGAIVHLSHTWRAVLERRHYPDPLTVPLGELMGAAALLSATLKYSGSITLQLQGPGPVKLLVVECTSELGLRATAKWEGRLATCALPDLLGHGHFMISLNPGSGGQSYQGIVSIAGQNVAQLLEHYMVNSEQIESCLWLAVNGHRAAGMLLQKMPDAYGAKEETWDKAIELANRVTQGELLTSSARNVIQRLYHTEDIRVFSEKPVNFRCSCSNERVAAMLRLVGFDEVHAILKERGCVEVTCEFCNQRYTFDAEHIDQLFSPELIGKASIVRH